MWLVIREDPGSAEATPPWGAATTAEYAERVSRNLAIIERNPDVKLNYDFGAYELADLVARHPDLHERMRAMVARSPSSTAPTTSHTARRSAWRRTSASSSMDCACTASCSAWP